MIVHILYKIVSVVSIFGTIVSESDEVSNDNTNNYDAKTETTKFDTVDLSCLEYKEDTFSILSFAAS